MEYFSSIQEDVEKDEKEEGELTSSSDDDDDDANNDQENISRNSHNSHTVEECTERKVIMSVEEPDFDEMSQIVVIDEWNLSTACDKENQSASCNKANTVTSRNKRNKSLEDNNRNYFGISCPGKPRNQFSARCKSNTPAASGNASEYKNYSSYQKSPRGLKRHYAEADNQSQPALKYSKPACTEFDFNLDDKRDEFSSSDKNITVDLRNQIRRHDKKDEFSSSDKNITADLRNWIPRQFDKNIAADLRSQLSRESPEIKEYCSPGKSLEQITRLNTDPGDHKAMLSRHSSAARQTSDYRIRSKTSVIKKEFYLSKYKKLRYQRAPSVRPASRNGSLQIQANNRGQREVVRKIKEQQFDQPMQNRNRSNHDLQPDVKFLREQHHEGHPVTLSQMYHNNTTFYNGYTSQGSNFAYTPPQISPHGIPVPVACTQLLPFHHNIDSNTSPPYPVAIPYHHQIVPVAAATPQRMQHLSPSLLSVPQPKPQAGNLSDDIAKKLSSIRHGEHKQSDDFSAVKSSQLSPQYVTSTFYYSSQVSEVGSYVSPYVFSRLGPQVENPLYDYQTGFHQGCSSDIQMGLDHGYSSASLSDSTKIPSNRNLFSVIATGCNTSNVNTAHEIAAGEPVSGGEPHRNVNENLIKTRTEPVSQEKQKLIQYMKELNEKNQKMKADINYKSNEVQKSMYKIDRTCKAKPQNVYKIDKRPVPDFNVQGENSYNTTREEKEEIILHSSAASDSLEYSLPKDQTVSAEVEAKPKGNEADRHHVVYSSPLRIFVFYRNKQASDNKTTEIHKSHKMGPAETLEDGDRHVTAMEDGDRHVTAIQDGDRHVTATQDGDRHVTATQDGDRHVTATQDGDRHVTATQDGDRHDAAIQDGDRHVTATQDGDRHDAAIQDGDRHVTAIQDGDRHVTAIQDGDRHDAATQDCDRHDIAIQDGDRHDIAIQDGDRHITAMEDGDRHVTATQDGDKHDAAIQDCDSHVTAIQDGDRHNAATQDGDRHDAATQDGDRHDAATQDGDRHDAATQDGDRQVTAIQDGDRHNAATQDGDRHDSAIQDGDSHNVATQDGDRHVTATKDDDRHVTAMSCMTSAAKTQEDCVECALAMANIEANKSHVVHSVETQDADIKDGMAGTEADEESQVMCLRQIQEDCEKHILSMNSTEADEESQVTCLTQIQEDCDKHVLSIESTEADEGSITEIQADSDKHVLAMESTKVGGEVYVTSTSQIQEDYDKDVCVMERTKLTYTCHLTNSTSTEEDYFTMKMSDANGSYVTSPTKTEEAWDKHSIALESTEANDARHDLGPVETLEDFDKLSSVMENAETNECHVTDQEEIEKNCQRQSLVMENAETNYGCHVTGLEETQEEIHKQYRGMESAETNDECHVMGLVEIHENCDKQSTVMESTETNDQSHVLVPGKTQDMCATHALVIESTKINNGNYVTNPPETQEDCDKHDSAMENTEETDENPTMGLAKTQETCNHDACRRQED